jgi:hypothetical protein
MRPCAALILCLLVGCGPHKRLGEQCNKDQSRDSSNGTCEDRLICVISDSCYGSTCTGWCVQLCKSEAECMTTGGAAPSSQRCCSGYVSPENGGPALSCACFHTP